MADKGRGLPSNVANNFGNLAPDPTPRPRRVFNPVPAAEEQPETPPATAAPPAVKKKGGRPKGPPKVKKTFYLASDLTAIEQTQLNLARNAGVLVKDESEVVDLALSVLAALAENTEFTEIINKIYKNR